jgi:hypothetical protein
VRLWQHKFVTGSTPLTERLVFRVAPPDKAAIRRRALACGLTLSSYLRQIALGTIPRARPSQVQLEAIYHLARIGNNLNQLTKAAHERRIYVLSRRLDETLTAVERAIRELER